MNQFATWFKRFWKAWGRGKAILMLWMCLWIALSWLANPYLFMCAGGGYICVSITGRVWGHIQPLRSGSTFSIEAVLSVEDVKALASQTPQGELHSVWNSNGFFLFGHLSCGSKHWTVFQKREITVRHIDLFSDLLSPKPKPSRQGWCLVPPGITKRALSPRGRDPGRQGRAVGITCITSLALFAWVLPMRLLGVDEESLKMG